MPSGRRTMPLQASDQPVKKQSKWSADEDALIIELRGRGMKWEDISKQLPGRSAISCRLHYQNYLERRSEWSEERKDKLAQLYERFKADMWARVAEELAVPWRAAEAMHWQLGESDMARRAGVVPFSLAAVNAEANAGRRNSPSRAHNTHAQAHLQPQPESKAAAAREVRQMSPHMLYGRGQQPPSGRPGSQGISSRRDSYPTPPRPVVEHPDMGYNPASGLAPIQTQTHLSGTRVLPSIAELTTGVAPYGVNPGPGPGIGPPNPVAPHHTAFVSANISYSAPPESSGIKRRASNDESLREANYRRRVG